MRKRKQLNVAATDRTVTQVLQIAEQFDDSQAYVVAVAVERLHTAVFPDAANVRIEALTRKIQELEARRPGPKKGWKKRKAEAEAAAEATADAALTAAQA